MYILFILILSLIAFFLLCFTDNSYHAGRLKLIGLICTLFAWFLLFSSFSLKSAIKERECIITTEETARYELLPFKVITSTPIEIEVSDSEAEKNTEPYYYVIRWDANNLGFYYKTMQNGVIGFEPGTITFWSDNNIFITDVYEGIPIILEITETSEYPISKFEKFWLGSDEIKTLKPKKQTRYEIYIPAGSIIENYHSEH